MKLSKLELDGTQEEIAQFLAMLDETEGLKGSVDDTEKFFREHFLKDKPTDFPAKKVNNENTKIVNENTKSSTNTTILNLVADIIKQEFTVDEIKIVANKLLSYANKKSRIESGN